MYTCVYSCKGEVITAHNSGLEGDKLLLLLLPVLKMDVDQPLQLNQVFVLTLLMEVLLKQQKLERDYSQREITVRER